MWMILKIILWILLAIVGLVLLVLLLVLFAPVTYKIDAEYDGKAKIRAKIRFLMVSVALRFNQEDKQLENVIRVAGFRIGGGRGSVVPAEDAADIAETLEAPVKDMRDTVEKLAEPVQPDTVIEASESEDVGQADFANEEFDLWNNEDSGDDEDGEEKASKEGFFTRLGILLKKLFEKLSRYSPGKLADRIGESFAAVGKKKRELEKKVDRLKKFWRLSCTVRTRSYLKKYIVSIFRHIAPRRVKGRVHYGFDEPYKTGQITGYLSLMPFAYQKGLSLEPDFYNKVMEANLYIRGRIHLGYILRIALNLNIWRTVKAVRKLVNK